MRNPWILVDVGDHRRLAVEHGPAANTGLERKPVPFPQRRYGILVGVVAVAALAQHEGRTVSPAQGARRRPDDALDRGEIAGHGEFLHGTDQPLHSEHVALAGVRLSDASLVAHVLAVPGRHRLFARMYVYSTTPRFIPVYNGFLRRVRECRMSTRIAGRRPRKQPCISSSRYLYHCRRCAGGSAPLRHRCRQHRRAHQSGSSHALRY